MIRLVQIPAVSRDRQQGHFGPFAFPGSLQRAAEQSWGWKEAKSLPAEHRAFIRIRLSYLFGADDDALVMPNDCDPLAELEFVTRVARALLDHSAALAYFNPNGEVLCNREMMDETLDGCARLEVPAINVWINVRLFNASDRWLLMDTVGMQQLDRPDCEACFLGDKYDPGEIDSFLRNATLYLFEHGEVIEDGDTMDGPGDVRWRAVHVEKELVSPPRPLLRWFPLDRSRAPAELVGR